MEEDKPVTEMAQHQLMALSSSNMETFILLCHTQVSPGHIHDEILLPLYLVVVNN